MLSLPRVLYIGCSPFLRFSTRRTKRRVKSKNIDVSAESDDASSYRTKTQSKGGLFNRRHNQREEFYPTKQQGDAKQKAKPNDGDDQGETDDGDLPPAERTHRSTPKYGEVKRARQGIYHERVAGV